MKMIGIAIAALLVLGGCGETIEVATRIARSEIHVDRGSPAELAQPDVVLEVDAFQHARAMRVREATIMRAGQAPAAFPLALAGDLITVPVVDGVQTYALENRGATNASLEAQCQSTLPLTLSIEFPDDGFEMVLDDDLVVFCP